MYIQVLVPLSSTSQGNCQRTQGSKLLEPADVLRATMASVPAYLLNFLFIPSSPFTPFIVSNFTSLPASSIEYYAHKMFIISRRYVVGMLFKDYLSLRSN